jgi:hypothetical protein
VTTPNIPAIETIYRGNRFRSRTEAKWAVFFDLIGEPYEYEPQGVRLPSGPYLPDFWLPRASTWFEVKGSWEAVGSLGKYAELAAASEHQVIVIAGQPGLEAEPILIRPRPWIFEGMEIGAKLDGSPAWVWPYAARFSGSAGGLSLSSAIPRFMSDGKEGGYFTLTLSPEAAGAAPAQKALREAGMARFEHGEKGARP